jgi:RNA polymerase sigma-70 factor (ECF subfamily)
MPRDLERASDELLLICARSGNARAARLSARWHPRLLNTARGMLRNDEQARDAVQNAWIGTCRGWLRLSDPAQFPA